jgi:hypothetical protein
LVALYPEKELSIHIEQGAAGTQNRFRHFWEKKISLPGIEYRFLGRPVQSLYLLSYSGSHIHTRTRSSAYSFNL